jgi:hypothetical protein
MGSADHKVGYGDKVLPGEDFSEGITRAQADALLRQDVQRPVRLGVTAPGWSPQHSHRLVYGHVFRLGLDVKERNARFAQRLSFPRDAGPAPCHPGPRCIGRLRQAGEESAPCEKPGKKQIPRANIALGMTT